MRAKQSGGVQELLHENIEVVVEQKKRERERVRQTDGAGVADGDMLIYEPQGFSLTILSFTETERGGEKQRESKQEAEDEREKDEMQNLGDSDGAYETVLGREGQESFRRLCYILLFFF